MHSELIKFNLATPVSILSEDIHIGFFPQYKEETNIVPCDRHAFPFFSMWLKALHYPEHCTARFLHFLIPNSHSVFIIKTQDIQSKYGKIPDTNKTQAHTFTQKY